MSSYELKQAFMGYGFFLAGSTTGFIVYGLMDGSPHQLLVATGLHVIAGILSARVGLR